MHRHSVQDNNSQHHCIAYNKAHVDHALCLGTDAVVTCTTFCQSSLSNRLGPGVLQADAAVSVKTPDVYAEL